ncbi:MAG: hypothetical protein AAF388_02530 [Bacteroidota bacterium]
MPLKELYKRSRHHALAHNSLFPTDHEKRVKKLPDAIQTVAQNDPRRIKEPEIQTLQNLLRTWWEQQKDQPVITNIISTNRLQSQEFKRSGKTGHRHILKLSYGRFLVGTQCVKNYCKIRKSEVFPKNFPLGIAPEKRFFGQKRNFELLINPHLLKDLKIPGKKFKFLDSFPGSEAPAPPLFPLLEWTKSPRSSPKLELRNKAMNDKVSSPGSDDPLLSGTLLEHKQGGEIKIDGQEPQGEIPRENQESPEKFRLSGKLREKLGAELSNQANREVSRSTPTPTPGGINTNDVNLEASKTDLFQLQMAGKEHLANAIALVQAYVGTIALAMGRIIYPSEQKRAVGKAYELISHLSGDALTAYVVELLKTIDHIGTRINQGADIYAQLPSRWFDKSNQYNIVGAYKRYYQAYLHTGELMKQAKKPEKLKARQQGIQDEEDRKLSHYHEYAYRLKFRLIQIHPTNHRLKQANIQAWAKTFQLMVTRDKKSLDEIAKVIIWILESETDRAKFWRHEVGGFGILSAGGIRRNYKTMIDQWYQDNKAPKSG